MLREILLRLAEGGEFSNKSVAKDLGIDECLVEQMIRQLQHLGYIEKENLSDCSANCKCSAHTAKGSCCGSHNININMWRLTGKGKGVV